MNVLESGTENRQGMEFTAIFKARQFQDVICRCFMTSSSVLPEENINTWKWQRLKKLLSVRDRTVLLLLLFVCFVFLVLSVCFLRISHSFSYSFAGTEQSKRKVCAEVMEVAIPHLLISLSWLRGWENLNCKGNNQISHLMFRTNWWESVVVTAVKNDWPYNDRLKIRWKYSIMIRSTKINSFWGSRIYQRHKINTRLSCSNLQVNRWRKD